MSLNIKPPVNIPIIAPLSVAKAIWNRKWLCAAIWVMLSAVTVVVVKMIPAQFRAEALVLVESQRIPEKYVAATVNSDLQDRLNALSKQILSYSRLVALIKKYDLYRKERSNHVMEEVVEMMRNDVGIRVEKSGGNGRPGNFRVSYNGKDRNIVAQVANEIASFFIEEDMRSREVEATGTSEFLNNQLAEAKRMLEEQERMLSQYKMQYNGELPEQENALIASIGQLKVQLTGTQEALNRAQQNKAMLETSLANAQTAEATIAQMAQQASAPEPAAVASEVTPRTTPVIRPQRESERIEAAIAALRVRYGEQHPEVKRALAELHRVREIEKNNPTAEPAEPPMAAQKSSTPRALRTAVVSPQYAQTLLQARERVDTLKSQLTVVGHEIQNLNRERERTLGDLTALQARIDKLPVREQQLAAVTRDYEITRTNYRSLLDKKLAADVAADMEKRQKAERFVMLEPARPPEKPTKPNRPVMAIGGSLFSLGLALAAALGLEFRRGTFFGEWELPSHVPILGRVPMIYAVKADRVSKRRAKLQQRASATIGAVIAVLSIRSVV